MNSLTRWSIRFRLLILAVAAGIVATGIAIVPRLAVEATPEFNPPHVVVQTEALGLSAEEVEQLITAPMEADILNGVAFLDEMRSESVPGLSSIDLAFVPGTDLSQARQLVAERLTRTRVLPKVSTPPVLMQPLSSTSRVMMIRLSSPEVGLMDLSVLARWNIKPRLMGVAGVANVAIWGQREQQMQVQVDPGKLAASGVTLNQVISTAGNAVWVSPLSFLQASAPGSGGFIETGNQRLGIQHVLPITTPADLARVSIEGSAHPMSLGEVASVVEDHQPLIGDAAAGGADPGLVLVVEKFPGTNTVEVTKALEAALKNLRPGLGGVTLDATVYRPASFLESAAGSLGLGGLVSVILVALLIGLAFRSWRLALVALGTLVATVAGSLLVLTWLGVGMNTMILAGLVLALTIVAGDAVADVHALRGGPLARGAAHAAAGVGAGRDAKLVSRALSAARTAVGFGSLVAVFTLLPTALLGGVEGAFLRPLLLTLAVTLAVALLLGWTMTIALATLLLSSDPGPRVPAFVGRGRDRYTDIVRRGGSRSTVVLGGATVLAVAGVALLPLLVSTAGPLPVLNDSNLLVQLESQAGTSIDEMNRITSRARSAVEELPGVQSVDGHIGRAITSDQVVDVSSAELWVTLDHGVDRARLAGMVGDTLGSFPGIRSQVQGYAQARVGSALSDRAHDFAVRVYGVDHDQLRVHAQRVADLLRGVDGLSGVGLDLPPTEPVAEVKVDLAAANANGIKPGEVRRAAAALIQGIDVGFLFEKQKVFQVIVTGAPAVRHSLTSVGDLMIDTPAGKHVRLADLAGIRIVPRDTVIRHVDTQRYIDVVASVSGRAVPEVAAEVQTAVHALAFPREYHAEVPARFSEQHDSSLLAIGAFLAVVLGVLVLLQTAVRSWRIAAALLVGLPVALSGGVAVALLSGGGTLISLTGLAVVLAITVRDAVLLVLAVRQIEEDSGRGEHAVLAAARGRVLPTLLSGGIAALALVPLAVFGGAVGLEILLPLAAVIWGGVLTSWLLTLVALPILLLRIPVPAGGGAFDGDEGRPATVEGTVS